MFRLEHRGFLYTAMCTAKTASCSIARASIPYTPDTESKDSSVQSLSTIASPMVP
nr:MAG TPA: hypothetical protein [Bacteriophage sp.]